jgi:F-type H+-transporting ATPase subunit gamma
LKKTKRFYPVSLKDLANRLKAVRAIGKITKTMKVVASSKMQQAQDAADQSFAFYDTMRKLFLPIEKKISERKKDSTTRPKVLTILVTTNRGLCGAINSQIVRSILNEPFISEEQILILGEKGVKSLQNNIKLKRNVHLSFHPSSKYPLSFLEAGAVGERLKGLEYDELRIIYNRFESLFKMGVDTIRIPSLKILQSEEFTEYLAQYEISDGSETLESLMEYYLAALINYSFYQNSAVEIISRRNAMDSASNNAVEIGDKIRIEYNKTRQAEITTELSEIVSGAAAVEEAK